MMNDIDRLKVLFERIVKNVINELYNPADICKTNTEKAIDAMSKEPMPTSNMQPINNPPKRKKVLVANKNREIVGV